MGLGLGLGLARGGRPHVVGRDAREVSVGPLVPALATRVAVERDGDGERQYVDEAHLVRGGGFGLGLGLE